MAATLGDAFVSYAYGPHLWFQGETIGLNYPKRAIPYLVMAMKPHANADTHDFYYW